MIEKGWMKKNLREVKGAFAIHLATNPLQYLCKTLLGAQGYAVMILGLQYMDASYLRNGIFLYIAGVLSAALCGAVDAVFQAKVECGIRLRQKQELLRTILYQKDEKQEHSTKIQEILITDVENIVNFFGTQINHFVTPIVVSFVCMAAVCTKSRIITVIVFLSMFLAAVINLYFLPRLHAQIGEVRKAENTLTSKFTDTLLGSPVIRVFCYQKYYLEEIGHNIQNTLNTQTKEVKIRFIQGVALNLLAFSSMTIPFLAGAVLTVKGRMSLSDMMYITQLSGNLLWFINTFSSTVTELQKTRVSKARIESVLAEGSVQEVLPLKKKTEERSWPAFVTESGNAVRLEHLNVTLAGRQILKDISLEVPKGACVAFVGESGCGKTTIFKALQDFVPYEGTISLFERNADSLEEQARYGLMSLVSQDVGLIGGTIYENILIGDQGASRKEVEEAAKMAQVDTFANSLEAGLETRIGENGSMLSGGQRQRIALARGFLKNAPILMLDEVTSALDPVTEEKIVSVVEELRGRYTILIIAQKLNTIRSADKIFCIRDGEIVGQGTHEELMAGCAEYRRLAENA